MSINSKSCGSHRNPNTNGELTTRLGPRFAEAAGLKKGPCVEQNLPFSAITNSNRFKNVNKLADEGSGAS